MRSILLSQRPETIAIDAGPAICVYHKRYAAILPRVAKCEAVEFDRLCDTFQTHDYFAGKSAVVFVGASRFFNPSTRFHPVFEVLQYGLPELRRFSVDTTPYIGPLWRLFAHFSLAGLPFGGYTYSYLLESHYNAHLDGARDKNPLDFETIRGYATGHVSIDYNKYFAEPKVAIVSVAPWVHEDYRQLKARLFDEHATIGPVLRGLAQFAQQVCPSRLVPQEHRMFDSPGRVRIVRTDLKVDEYLTDRLLAKADEVNRVVEALQP